MSSLCGPCSGQKVREVTGNPPQNLLVTGVAAINVEAIETVANRES